MIESAWIEIIIFDRIARLCDIHALQSVNGAEHRQLRLDGQRRRNTVRVNQWIVAALGLEKNLMPVTVAEPDNLVLDRGTIARTARFNGTSKHR